MKMFKKNRTKELINILIDSMMGEDPRSEEYAKMAETLVKLDKGKISADTKALIITNLAGIVLILNYEKVGIITSKAFSLVRRVF